MRSDCTRRVFAEAAGTAFLLATVVGSGIMGSRLAADVPGVLEPPALATGGILFVMIRALGPISGAHFNPAVTMAFVTRREMGRCEGGLQVIAQIPGGAVGVLLVHMTFSEPIIQVSATARDGFPLLFEEPLATAGLVGVILATVRRGADVVAGVVGIYIALAIWSTSSTCFANPAVTITRLLTDIMTGIAPASVPGFVIAQLIGGAIGACFIGWLLTARGETREGQPVDGLRTADRLPHSLRSWPRPLPGRAGVREQPRLLFGRFAFVRLFGCSLTRDQPVGRQNVAVSSPRRRQFSSAIRLSKAPSMAARPD